jgi:AcrR family transcriptional regulator
LYNGRVQHLSAVPAEPRATKKAAQREASMERLTAAAARLFVSQGYRATTLDQIAAAAGYTKGLVYFHFKSKTALLMGLLDRVERHVVDAVVARVEAQGGSAADRMVAFLHTQAELGVERSAEVLLVLIMSLEFGGREGEVSARIAAIYQKLHDLTERVVRDGQRSGEFRTDIPARELATMIMAVHDGTFLEWHRRKAHLDGRQLVRAMRSLVLDGLAPG